MNSTMDALLAVIRSGGHLSIVGDQLRVEAPPPQMEDLRKLVKQHKAALLLLLALEFYIVRSNVLDEIVFFAADDITKQSLISAGADSWTIYTTAELSALVRQQVTPDQLRLIHAAKREFNGKVANP